MYSRLSISLSLHKHRTTIAYEGKRLKKKGIEVVRERLRIKIAIFIIIIRLNESPRIVCNMWMANGGRMGKRRRRQMCVINKSLIGSTYISLSLFIIIWDHLEEIFYFVCAICVEFLLFNWEEDFLLVK